MNRIEKVGVAAVFLLSVAGVFAQQAPTPGLAQNTDVPEWPERVLYFEVSDEPLELQDFKARPGVIWPRFAATFNAEVSNSAWEALFCVSLDGDSPEERTQALLESTAASGFSERQLEFVRTSPWLHHHRPGGPSWRSFTLHAVSEADARQMVVAVFEVLDAPGHAAFEEMKTKLLDRRAKHEEARKKLVEMKCEMQEASDAYDTVRKASGYENHDSAAKDLERLDVSLRLVEVTIAGINAKIAAIEKLITERSASLYGSTAQMLERLHVEQDIELAGALARRDVLEGQRKRAQTHLDAWRNHDAIVKKAEEANTRAHHRQIGVENWLKRLQDPSASVGRVNLMGNVTVQSIEYPGD